MISLAAGSYLVSIKFEYNFRILCFRFESCGNPLLSWSNQNQKCGTNEIDFLKLNN